MFLILAVIAAIGAGVIGYRASTGYHTGVPAHETAVAPPATTPPAQPAAKIADTGK